MKATFLGTLQSPAPGIEQRHWKLSEPLREFDHVFHYVVTSAAIVGGVPETYIFGARSDGTIAFFVELLGSIRGVIDHEPAIRNAGWTIAMKPSTLRRRDVNIRVGPLDVQVTAGCLWFRLWGRGLWAASYRTRLGGARDGGAQRAGADLALRWRIAERQRILAILTGQPCPGCPDCQPQPEAPN